MMEKNIRLYLAKGDIMRKIVLTTESGADLPEKLVHKFGIKVVPMHVIMDGKDYKDGSIPVTDIFDYYESTKKIPSTTSTNPNEYTELFQAVRAENPESMIVHVGYTSQASSSFQNALIAGEDFNDIYFVDTLNVTGGLGAVVLYAAELLQDHPTIGVEDLIAAIEQVVPKTKLAFLPGNLEYLRAGGRVTNAQYLGASLLKLKPMIELINGKLVSTKKYRGKMLKATTTLLHDYFKNYNIDRKQLYFIYSVGLEEEIKRELEKVAAEYDFHHIEWIEAGCVITCHSGPGAFGVAGIEI